MNAMPLLVSATADMAPPPFAVPSILVMMTPSILIASWKRRACSLACWPRAASITSQRWVALVSVLRSMISWIRSASSACRPWVSTMISSWSFKRCKPFAGDLQGILLLRIAIAGDMDLLAQGRDLVEGTGPERIGTDHADFHAFLLEIAGKLCGRGGLAAALQSCHEDCLGLERHIRGRPDRAGPVPGTRSGAHARGRSCP